MASIGAWGIAAALLSRTQRDYPKPEVTAAGAVESGAWSQQCMPAAPARASASA